MAFSPYLSRKLFVLRQAARSKTFVPVLSCMRSGSTLLKSLLAMGPDVSHLPEVDFRRFQGTFATWKFKALSAQRIIVLKKPAPFDFDAYPALPAVPNLRSIILIRDAYETVASLRKMVEKVYPELRTTWTDQQLLEAYWLPVNRLLLAKHQADPSASFMLRYEDLTTDAISVTEKLFRFIGSVQTQGLDHYHPPENYDWAWGNDDGGEVIKSCRVNPSTPERTDQALLQLIESSPAVQALRTEFGYLTPPA